ncbi:MAG: hypothetical protein ACRD1L_11645, partial [Terriglobales bacterium]
MEKQGLNRWGHFGFGAWGYRLCRDEFFQLTVREPSLRVTKAEAEAANERLRSNPDRGPDFGKKTKTMVEVWRELFDGGCRVVNSVEESGLDLTISTGTGEHTYFSLDTGGRMLKTVAELLRDGVDPFDAYWFYFDYDLVEGST